MSKLNTETATTGHELNTEHPRTGPAIVWILHVSFLVSVVVFILLHTFAVQPQLEIDPLPQDAFGSAWFFLFAVLTAVQALVGWKMPRFMGRIAPCARQSAAEYIKCAQITTCVSDSIFELIAFYGLFGPFVNINEGLSYLLFAIALGLQLALIPRIQQWVDEYRRRLRSELHHHQPSVAQAVGAHHQQQPQQIKPDTA